MIEVKEPSYRVMVQQLVHCPVCENYIERYALDKYCTHCGARLEIINEKEIGNASKKYANCKL